jgi:hypothetical protein
LLWPLDDPYLGGLDAYRQCLAQLQATLEAHVPQFLGCDRPCSRETMTDEGL